MRAQPVTIIATTLILTFSTALAAAAVPGDVNGDGVVAADDVACVAATVFDAGTGCAAAVGSLANVITVSPSGADFEHLDDALASITDSNSLNPYIVVLGPGMFFGPVTVPDHVSLVGSGSQATTILQSDPDTTVLEDAAVRCLGTCTLQDLAIYVQSFANPGTVAVALHVSDAATVRNSTIEVHDAITGYGIFANATASLDLVDSAIDVRQCSTGYGVWSDYVAEVRRSHIRCREGDTLNVGFHGGASALITASTIETEGDLASTSRGAEVGYATIHDSEISALGGGTATAVRATGTVLPTPARWYGNTFTASSASTLSAALEVTSNANFTIVDTAFAATNSPSTWGIAIDGSVLFLSSIDVFSFGVESDHHGIYQHTTGGDVTLTHSKVTGSTDALLDEVAGFAHIGSSQLIGGIDNAGGASLTCVASWDGSWNPLSSSCD